MTFGEIELVCGCCGSKRIELLRVLSGFFSCQDCHAVGPATVREEEHDWDAAMSELWAAEGHTVGGAT